MLCRHDVCSHCCMLQRCAWVRYCEPITRHLHFTDVCNHSCLLKNQPKSTKINWNQPKLVKIDQNQPKRFWLIWNRPKSTKMVLVDFQLMNFIKRSDFSTKCFTLKENKQTSMLPKSSKINRNQPKPFWLIRNQPKLTKIDENQPKLTKINQNHFGWKQQTRMTAKLCTSVGLGVKDQITTTQTIVQL